MRTLRFIVHNNTIVEDPSCDFTGLFPTPNQEIQAEFIFSNEWTDRVKVAAFYSVLGTEYPPQIIDENRCMIPPEALISPVFRIQILGNRYGLTTSTNTLTIYQRGGNV